MLGALVLADPASVSGKARLADEHGVRKVSERAFWASIAVDVDEHDEPIVPKPRRN